MKMTLSIISLVFLVISTSCSKDNDPSDDNLFVGTYNGTVSYSNPDDGTEISTDDGRVTLVKVGDAYNFDFSDGIPSLNGIEMEKNENVFISSDGAIKIDEGTLLIAYSSENETWGANCDR
ncbi:MULTISPECIES: hypothetical protein [unclassified Arenibacter]|uniref:hypothetical protein n=1 Tax=unclassified Arenibacter TaxID=2615047 RepID=UPI000E34DCEC|nr:MULTISPECIES: hypothetical protein [unclassified Arenibacter]MCM4162980.1 hypothetical protein [Arenibacter sp. A80]RFT57019.1 hypothetical protein D0S24_05175 [Arenibacter sp. P308M17]